MLRIHQVIVQLVGEVAPVAACIARHDADLARQLRRALSSVPLNVAEGSDQRGARRLSHYSIALGSAREAWSAVLTATAWGYIEPPSAELKARFDHVIGTLHRNVRPVR
jgi:four helix bundle protein